MSLPLLSETLPELWALAVDLSAELRAGQFLGWATLNSRLFALLRPSLLEACLARLPGWHQIVSQREALTARHTLLVLALALNLPEYQAASEPTQHEIEWAALLHDLAKDYDRTPPLRDTSHPFRSAALVVSGLPALGFAPQPGVQAADLARWAGLVRNAERPESGQWLHDHTPLPEIIALLHQHWGPETSASRILKAILFHQSLPTLVAWTNPVLLTDTELRAFLTPADLDVLLPLLIADSDAWNLFDEPRLEYLAELRANNAETRHRWALGSQNA